MGFFASLQDILFPPRETERIVRALLEEEVVALVIPRLIPLPGGETAVALMPYKNPKVHALIVEAKFYESEKAQQILGAILAEYLLEHSSDERSVRPTMLVPVPLSKIRRRERGYNQMERIGVCAMKHLYDEYQLVTEALTRVRDTRPQTNLPRAKRLENLTNAFVASPIKREASYLVADDVVTTGATLSSASAAFRAAGVRDISCIALAYAGEK